jgi:RND family efflux transporter MFP subunit
MKTKYIVLTGVLVIALLIAFKLSSNKAKINEKNNKSTLTNVRIPVKVAAAENQLLEISIKKTGNLAPFKEAKVLALTGGNIRELRFKLGDHVNQGQILAVTDARLLQLELEKAESSAHKARYDVDVYVELLQGKATTQEKVNNLRQAYLDAVNQVDQARKNLADLSIKAPTSGIISAKAVEEGVYVNAGGEIATIINLSKAKVQVNLTENEVYQVTTGQQIKITTDVYPGKVFNGTVSFISPQADQTHNYPAEIMVDNASRSVLRSGTFVYADFSRKTKQQMLVIPREALTESVKNASVYVVVNNVARQKMITTGLELGGNIQVLSGLSAGDMVVTSGQINLKDGGLVKTSK